MTDYTTSRRTFMGGLAAGTLAGLPAGAIADDDSLGDYDRGAFMYISIDGIDAADVKDVPENSIPGFAWGWGVPAPGTGDSLTGIEPLYFQKDVDQTTPQLLRSVAEQRQHDWALLTLQQPTGSGSGRMETVLTITMEPVRIISQSMAGQIGYDGTHPEIVELVFQKATVEHTPSGYAYTYWPGSDA